MPLTPRRLHGSVGGLRWRPLVALLVPAVVLLVLTIGLSLMVARSATTLGSTVPTTQAAVDGNVRALVRVQRELLRLDVVLAADRPSATDLARQRALVDQRVQESTRADHGQVVGDGSIGSRTRALAATWTRSVDPAVRQVAATPPPAAAPPPAATPPPAAAPATDGARRTAAAQLDRLEGDYDRLVSDAEVARTAEVAAANRATSQIVSGTRWLLLGLLTSLVSFGALVAGMVRMLQRSGEEQRRAAGALDRARSTLQRHSLAVQTTDNLVVVTDGHGRTEWVNDAFIRHTGWSADEVVGTVPGHLLQGPDTDPGTISFMRERMGQQEGFTCEVLNYTKATEPYWVQLEVRPIRDTAGGTDGFVAVASDITTRREAADALRRAKEAAEETARAKASFLASMSHEIRTPLNAVLGLTELLLDTPLGAEQRQYASTAHHSGRLLLSLLNDILDYSALDSGHVEIDSTPVEVTAVLEDVEQMLRPMATQRGLTLSHRVGPEVPALVSTDGNRVRQVLINLVGNGLRFTPAGEVCLEVSYRADRSPDGSRSGFLGVAVRDTGIGIPADRLERIFEPFSQGDASTSRTHGGTGLGLAICTHVAAQMAGDLGVTSVPGVGSTFTFTVPVGDGGSPALPSPGPRRPSATSVDVQLRVLLAEDDPVNRLVALHMLRRLGIDPDVAVDGREAVELGTTRGYDVVLMDVHMPGTDGLEATRLIREHLDHPPRIVALTANALEGDRERLLAAGMDGYVSKPFTLDDLASALGRPAPEPTVPVGAADLVSATAAS